MGDAAGAEKVVVRLRLDDDGSWRWVAVLADGQRIAVSDSGHATRLAAERAAVRAFPRATVIIEPE